MDTPLTDIHSADVLTSSIQVLRDSFHKNFQYVSKPRQKMVDAFRFPEHINDLKKREKLFKNGLASTPMTPY